MHKNCNKGQYELAEQEGSFFRLLPYQCLLLKWQLRHPKHNRQITMITSHLHGLVCYFRCPPPKTKEHMAPHGHCGGKCKEIEHWMVQKLREHLILIVKNRQIALKQQVLEF